MDTQVTKTMVVDLELGEEPTIELVTRPRHGDQCDPIECSPDDCGPCTPFTCEPNCRPQEE